MKHLFTALFLSFFTFSFAQFPSECDIFKITQKGLEQNIHVILVSHNNKEIYPARNIDRQEAFKKMISLYNSFSKVNNLKEINLSEIKSKLNYIEGDVFICSKRFEEQITPFLNKEINEVTLISTKGIPFLTFTRIE